VELRHLRYFIAVAEYGNVRVASTHLHVTQPAVSRQIHDLEEELGVSLFDRTPRGLRLTKAGEQYLPDARNALAMLEAAGNSARMVASGRLGKLSIGVIESAGWDGLVPNAFGAFQKEHHDVGIQLTPMTTPEQLTAIEAGLLDGGFVYLFDPIPDAFEGALLERHDVVLAVPLEWRPGGALTTSVRSLVGQPFITFQRPVYPAYYDRLLSACSQAGLTLRVVQEVGSEAAILSLVSAGIGIAIVNACNRGRPPARVRFLQLADLSIPLPLSFIRLRANTNPALQRFADALGIVRSP
jgi:DNA-binding transcriptional LysR family regulator